MFITFFLLLGAFFIISEQNIKLNNGENFEKFLEEYTEWVYELVNKGKTVSSYVVKMHWLPEETE